MNRYSKKKHSKGAKKNHMEKREALNLVKTTNLFNLAIAVRTLHMVEGWGEKRLARYMESYIALIEEVGDARTTVTEFVEDTKELTGFDVEAFLEKVAKQKAEREAMENEQTDDKN